MGGRQLASDPCAGALGAQRLQTTELLLEVKQVGGWVNSRFPRLTLSLTEWHHRGNEGERSRLTLTVEVPNVPARTSENTYLLGHWVIKGKKKASISAPRPSETERKGQRGCM
jgi:hypothetical protein